jgi:hypothetical protein
MKTDLCPTCQHSGICAFRAYKNENGGHVAICGDYSEHRKPTDKQLKEQAEKEIAEILARLNADCEMIVGCVFVDCQKTFDTDGKAVKEHCGFEVSILMK